MEIRTKHKQNNILTLMQPHMQICPFIAKAVLQQEKCLTIFGRTVYITTNLKQQPLKCIKRHANKINIFQQKP